MNMRRVHAAIESPRPLWRDTPDYPGIPTVDMATKITNRATVDYDTYVLRYDSRQRANVVLCVGGAALMAGAVGYLTGGLAFVGLAVGLVSTLAGAVGFIVAKDAHNSYTQHLAVAVSETYHRPPEPKAATARPFVASENGRTTHTGRLQFAPEVWRALFDMALASGGAITKTIAAQSGVSRQWYHTDYAASPDGFRQLLIELRRVGFIDAQNTVTSAALEWYQAQYPALPLASVATRPGIDRPTRGSDLTDPDGGGEGGWE